MWERDHLHSLRQRPGMHLISSLRFESLVTYVSGMDAQSHGLLLDGFREFLLLRGAAPPNLAWPSLVTVLSGSQGRVEGLAPDEDAAATELLFELLDEFVVEVGRSSGRADLYREYVLWRQFPDDNVGLELQRFSSSPPPETVGLEDVMSLLGIDRRGVSDLVSEGKLRLFRVGGDVLFGRAEIDELQSGSRAR